ncbi:hypothetical protein [Pseudoxanthomonas sp. JBR18]|uniref:hypothetical protein n=1 Tax=Pseudoxanthomonas sp. JBR18 TaxID=2969308 RepID=UPI002304ED80|nr:hypothetical protein [Pseudoxanthomonas sp. JBR18]WCE05528.1 hypothetical protein PJ250_06090 [Pseudoxanthomonas sp. JBR18]
MTENKPWLSTLAFVGFQINSAVEEGHGDALLFTDVYQGLERGTLLEDINNKLPGVCDFSLYPTGSEQSVALHEALKLVAGWLRGRERRKVGIERSGLHLLLAYILEAMQQQYWVKPR